MNRDPYARRDYAMGAMPFENLKRVDTPTTFIDEDRVARVPKRTDMFARAQFGDMGKRPQESAAGGGCMHVKTHPPPPSVVCWGLCSVAGWQACEGGVAPK